MPAYNMLDLSAIVRSWGRGLVFYHVSDINDPLSAVRWDPTTPLLLRQLGDTEGDLNIATNPQVDILTVPELTGPAGPEGDYTGENPVLEMPIYLTDPLQLAVCSPSQNANAGRSMRGGLAERTLVMFPQALFTEIDANGILQRREVDFTGGVWSFNGTPMDAARLALVGGAFWLWRCFFNRPPRRFLGGTGDARKNIESVSVQGLHHPDMPEGHHLYTQGNPFTYGINLEGSS